MKQRMTQPLPSIGRIALVLLVISTAPSCLAFSFVSHRTPSSRYSYFRQLYSTSSSDTAEPQVLASGYSSNERLEDALREATSIALDALPLGSETSKIDLAVISVSSLYDGSSSPSVVVPTLLEAASTYGTGIQHVIGSTAGGIVSSIANVDDITSSCTPVELEGALGVSVTLMVLPDVNLRTFHVLGDDVPDDFGRISPKVWKQAVGLAGLDTNEESPEAPIFMLLPSPGFQNDLDDLLRGLQSTFPLSKTFGAIASTVSSLSRARLFRYDVADAQCQQTMGNGCVGVALTGDIDVRTMVAQGAKPVGGIYQILKGEKSTINAIVLDEAATQVEKESSEEDDQEDEGDNEFDEDEPENKDDKKAQMAAAYAKASIPKPCLAEANFIMRTLSDDDQAFMRKALLVGLERGGSIGRTPSELARLRAGQGHRFHVYQCASAGMKDGSITLPLGSVNVSPGTRMRFFVRESGFAKKEVGALWNGYKKKVLNQAFRKDDEGNDSSATTFQPTGCLVFPTLDRGGKFFKGKSGFESRAVANFVPEIPCIAGFYNNGVIMKLDEDEPAEIAACTHGSSSGYVLFGSKSGRPLYHAGLAAKMRAEEEMERERAEAAEREIAEEDQKRKQRAKAITAFDEKAPRSEDGELIIKRREIHSGRALTVSTVEWSVAERTAKASSTLESFMWDKETEVDRFRERVPLANLVSQCNLSATDPTKPKPRDWVGRLKQESKGGFLIIPECKRIEPFTGSVWKRYDVEKLAKQFAVAGVPVFSINCDAVMFGGSLEDITKARRASSAAAVENSTGDDGVLVPPILASDLLLYPYQLYKLRLAGADAVNLVAAALAAKDLLYLSKIAASLQLQSLITVTSEVQLRAVAKLSPGAIHGIIVSNRELEDFSFDMTGQQALSLLKSDALQEVKSKHGQDIPVLVEGRVGMIERKDPNGEVSTSYYLQELQEAGAVGALVGGGLATTSIGSELLGISSGITGGSMGT